MAGFYASQPQDAPVLIYALCEPDDAECVRYVGQTTKTIEQRLDWHIREAEHPTAQARTYARIQWLRSLLAKGKRPIIKLVTTTDIAHAFEVERATVEEYEQQGAALVNGPYTRAFRERQRAVAIKQHQDRQQRGSGGKGEGENGTVATSFRLPRALHERLTELAAAHHHSLNAEIVAQLEQAEDADFIARYGPLIRTEVNRMLAEQHAT